MSDDPFKDVEIIRPAPTVAPDMQEDDPFASVIVNRTSDPVAAPPVQEEDPFSAATINRVGGDVDPFESATINRGPTDLESSYLDIAKTVGASLLELVANVARTAVPRQAPSFRVEKSISRKEIEPGKWGTVLEENLVETNNTQQVRESLAGPFEGLSKVMSLSEAQERVRRDLGMEHVGFFRKGAMLLADNAGNMLSSTGGMPVAMVSMYSNETQNARQSMQQKGVTDPEILELFSGMYGAISTPIEYSENAIKVGKFLGKGISNPVKKYLTEALKNAGINIAQEAVQQFIQNVVTNAAISEHNRTKGTSLELIPLTDELGNAVEGSAAMSTVLAALGLGAKGAKALLPSETTTEVAQKKTTEEIEVAQQTAAALAVKESLSDAEMDEFNNFLKELNQVDALELQEMRIVSDINNLSAIRPDIISPDNITPDMDASNPDLVMTASALSDMYGTEISPEQVRDLFVSPVERISKGSPEQQRKQKQNKVAYLEKSMERLSEGKAKLQEVVEALGAVDPALQEEFIDRTTGTESEPMSVVLSELVEKSKQEKSDDIEREQTRAAEQQEVRPQEEKPTSVDAETTEADGVQRTGEQEVDAIREQQATEIPVREEAERSEEVSEALPEEKQTEEKVVYPPNPQLPFAEWYKKAADFALKMVQSGVSRSEFVSDMEAEYLHYDATSVDLADMWNQAVVDNKRIKAEVAAAEKANLKGDRIKQKAEEGTALRKKKIEVNEETLTKELFRVQQRASAEGAKEGRNQMRAAFRGLRDNADRLRSLFMDQIAGMKGATDKERTKLRELANAIYKAKTTTSQNTAFEKLMDETSKVMQSIADRTVTYETRPVASYGDVRRKFLNLMPDIEDSIGKKVTSKKEMLDYIEGRKAIPDAIKDKIVNAETIENAGTIARLALLGGERIKAGLNKIAARSTRIAEIDKDVVRALYETEQNAALRLNDSLERTKKFVSSMTKALKNRKGAEYNKLVAAISNGDAQAMREAGIVEWDAAREVLDEYAKIFNIPTDQKYFPRHVKNLEGLDRFLRGNPRGPFEIALKNAKTKAEKDSAIRGVFQQREGAIPSSFKKSRAIDEVTEDIAQFYERPDITFAGRLAQMARAAALQEVLGISPQWQGMEISSDIDVDVEAGKNIPAIIQAALERGDLSIRDQNELKKLVGNWLRPARASESLTKLYKLYKKGVQTKYISQVHTALVQFADLGVMSAEKGIGNTFLSGKEMQKWTDESGKQVANSLEEIGADKVDVDLQDFGSKLFSSVFALHKSADQFNKRKMNRATLRRWRTKANKDKAGLIRELEKQFGQRRFAEKVANDAAKGNMSKEVRLAAFMDMAGFHPTTDLEILNIQATTPNAAPLFALKSFALKRYDRFYRQVLREYTDGVSRMVAGAADNNRSMFKDGAKKVASGSVGLAKYYAGTVAVEAAFRVVFDAIKAALKGEDYDLEDAIESFKKNSLNEMLSSINPFFSLYGVEQAWTRKQPELLIDDVTKAPTPLGVDTVRALFYWLNGDDEKAIKYGLREIPFFGRWMSDLSER